MQMAFYFDQSRCIGCYACGVACKDCNDVEAGPAQWRRVTCTEKGTYPDVFVTYLSLSCAHCSKPACAAACPARAINKRKEDGVVTVDREACLGRDMCGAPCKDACPYAVPQFGDEENPKMQMCHFCIRRLKEKKNPVCVEACPVRALDAGPLDELREKYHGVKSVEGFLCSNDTEPSILFKAK